MSKQNNYRSINQKGSVIVSILVITLFLTTLIFSLIVLANANLARARNRVLLLQAQYSAESGADSAIAVLNSGNSGYSGTGSSEINVLTTSLYKATYTTTVSDGSTNNEKIINAVGKIYAPANSAVARFSRSIEIVASRSSSTGSSSMLSRNILEAGSSVKDIKAKDVFVNGYINLTKNTNNLIAESITVADKNTGAANCSIGGTGTLSKPTSFSNPAQTKTQVTLAYSNCISPPGNTSNADFDVLANQTNISKIQSTLIPVAQYMDNTYLDAANCNDWTSGSSPRSIPSTGNDKKTHYPDSGTGTSTSCGSSGSLDLGSNQYNILDHVHVRANLCSASACTPTFYNPDSGAAGIKFVFIEGSLNFDSLTTASGSGPIVFVVYGADPSSKAAVCPLGGAVYLGNNGNTVAPAAYFLASNGVCLDKTKFGAIPALGGLSGKNIYISTNSGTPHDLSLDVGFPVSSIPVDLSWRASRYRRL